MDKRLAKYIGAALLLVSSFSCSDLRFGDAFLEKAPGVDVTIDTIFSSKLYADRALVSAYSTLRCGYTVHNPAWPVPNGTFQYEEAGNKVGIDVLDALTDIIETHCTWGGVMPVYYQGQYNAEQENILSQQKFGFNPTQDNTWKGIRKAFLYINNVNKVPDMSDDEKTIRKGEAYVIIACHYLEMMRHFGGVPILKSDVQADNDTGVDYTRRPVEEVLAYIIEICDKAADMLPWTVPGSEDGRMTKAAAMGLKCRALMMAASPLFNSNEPYSNEKPKINLGNIGKVDEAQLEKMYWLGGYDQSRWQEVVDACEDFFRENHANGNAYSLIQAAGTSSDDYRSAWNRTYADRNNGEIIIGTGRHYPTFADTYHRCYFGPSDDHGNTGRGYGGGCITLNFVDMFTNTDGTPSSYRDWIADHDGKGTLDDHPFLGKDPRLYESVMIVGDHFQDRPAEMWVGGRERSAANDPRAITGFCSRKFLWDYNDATFMNRLSNYAYLRLADIWLIYAEALNEVGRRDEAMQALNMVRNRVGLPDMTGELLLKLHGDKDLPSYGDCALMGDAMLREEILDERARELYFEESRWFDMVRWEREDIFRKTLYGITISIESGTLDGGDMVLKFSEPSELTERYWKKDWNTKWYLSAFPSNEVNKGYGLVQNPGW